MALTPFELYFRDDFQKLLETVPDDKVFSNQHSIKDSSWDRKAAYLLWKAGVERPVDTDDWDIL